MKKMTNLISALLLGIFALGIHSSKVNAYTRTGTMNVTVVLEDTMSQPETELTVNIYRTSDNAIVYTFQAPTTGDYSVPIELTAPDNTTVTEGYYAKSVDANSNLSESSNIVVAEVTGTDTVPPKPPVCGEVVWN